MLDLIPEGYISLDEAVGPLTVDISDQELAEEQQCLESQDAPGSREGSWQARAATSRRHAADET